MRALDTICRKSGLNFLRQRHLNLKGAHAEKETVLESSKVLLTKRRFLFHGQQGLIYTTCVNYTTFILRLKFSQKSDSPWMWRGTQTNTNHTSQSPTPLSPSSLQKIMPWFRNRFFVGGSFSLASLVTPKGRSIDTKALEEAATGIHCPGDFSGSQVAASVGWKGPHLGL